LVARVAVPGIFVADLSGFRSCRPLPANRLAVSATGSAQRFDPKQALYQTEPHPVIYEILERKALAARVAVPGKYLLKGIIPQLGRKSNHKMKDKFRFLELLPKTQS